MTPSKRLIVILRGAINNELRRDEFFNLEYNKNFCRVCNVPRIEKLSNLFQKLPIVMGVLSLVFTYFWIVIGVPVFTLGSLLCHLFISEGRHPSFNCDVGLSNSPLASSLIDRHAANASKVEVVPFWRSIVKKKCTLNAFIFATKGDVFKAHIIGIWMIYNWRLNLFKLSQSLHSYVVFDFILHWIVLNRILKNVDSIYFAADADRWATLFSSLKVDSKKILVQHGLVQDLDIKDNWRPKEALRYKLKNVHIVITFDTKQEPIYRAIVLSSQTKCVFQLQPPRFFKAKKIENNVGQTVLAICSPGTAKQEINDLEFIIRKCPTTQFYVRPHPSYNWKRYKVLENVNVIIDFNEDLQLTDVVLFWTQSTLTYHLSKTGVLVVDMARKGKDGAVKEILENST